MSYPTLNWFRLRQGLAALPLYGPPLTFTLRTPLLSSETARAVLDCTQRNLDRLIEEGAVWAWDIGVNFTSGRPSPRLLALSLLAIAERKPQLNPASAEAALDLILPRARGSLTTIQVGMLMQTNRQWMINRVARGELEVATEHIVNGRSYNISVASIRQFLLKRLIQ
jgi:hypothetical protein